MRDALINKKMSYPEVSHKIISEEIVSSNIEGNKLSITPSEKMNLANSSKELSQLANSNQQK